MDRVFNPIGPDKIPSGHSNTDSGDHITHLAHETSAHSSAAQRLPAKILEEVCSFCTIHDDDAEAYFVLLLDESPRGYQYDSDSHRPYMEPLSLSHVCQLWRRVAISIPRLWSTIVVMPQDAFPRQLIRIWLERSKDHPLIICIRILLDPNSAPHDQERIYVYSMIFAQVSRWRRVFAKVDDLKVALAFLPLQSESPVTTSSLETPLLESVHFTIASNSVAHRRVLSDWFASLIVSAPNVTHVTWNSWSFALLYQYQRTLFRRLLYLQVGMARMGEILSIVRTPGSVLETLVIGNNEYDAQSFTGEIFMSSSLTSLTYRAWSAHYLAFFLDHVAFPSLTELQLCMERSWCQDSLLSFLHRSDCRLKTVMLQCGTYWQCGKHKKLTAGRDADLPWALVFKFDHLIDILSHKTIKNSLTTLMLVGKEITKALVGDELLQHLIVHRERAVSLPSLTDLTVGRYSTSVDGILADMIESRLAPEVGQCAQLKRLEVAFPADRMADKKRIREAGNMFGLLVDERRYSNAEGLCI